MSAELAERPYVQVPRDLLTGGLPAGAVTLWIVLVTFAWSTGVAFATQATLMSKLGREGKDPRAIRRYARLLSDAGWLQVRREQRNGVSRNYYTPRRIPEEGDGCRFEPLAAEFLDHLEQRRLTPELLVAQARWHDAAGGRGWTGDTLAEYARKYGQPISTAKHMRARLVSMALLEVSHRRGVATITSRPGRLPGPADSGAAGAVSTRPEVGPVVADPIPISRAGGGRPLRPVVADPIPISRAGGGRPLRPVDAPEVHDKQVPPESKEEAPPDEVPGVPREPRHHSSSSVPREAVNG